MLFHLKEEDLDEQIPCFVPMCEGGHRDGPAGCECDRLPGPAPALFGAVLALVETEAATLRERLTGWARVISDARTMREVQENWLSDFEDHLHQTVQRQLLAHRWDRWAAHDAARFDCDDDCDSASDDANNDCDRDGDDADSGGDGYLTDHPDDCDSGDAGAQPPVVKGLQGIADSSGDDFGDCDDDDGCDDGLSASAPRRPRVSTDQLGLFPPTRRPPCCPAS